MKIGLPILDSIIGISFIILGVLILIKNRFKEVKGINVLMKNLNEKTNKKRSLYSTIFNKRNNT